VKLVDGDAMYVMQYIGTAQSVLTTMLLLSFEVLYTSTCISLKKLVRKKDFFVLMKLS